MSGGDAFCPRLIDRHLAAMRATDAEIISEDGIYRASYPCGAARAFTTDVNTPYGPSLGATVTAMLLAARTDGTSLITHPSIEPEVTQTARFLRQGGAGIGWDKDGLHVTGTSHLAGTRFTVAGDRIEAATMLTAMAATGGRIRLDQYRNTATPLHQLICGEPLESQPGQHRYINRGFILLGLALAHIYARPLHALAAQLWASAGMPATVYGPVTRSSTVAPTEQILPGAPRLWGGPHDDNAALMGCIAGHAGVFSTPADLAAYAEHLLSPSASNPLGEWLHASLAPHAPIESSTSRGLAWILADGGQVAYHHGFTGTSLYLNPRHRRYILICTNAIYHGPARERLQPLRDLALHTITQP